MRPLAVAALVVSACLAAAVRADPVIEVRSGEHPGFSRLVLDFAQGPEWTLTEEPGLARLAFSAPPGRFDLDGVFRFIPRTRIAEVRQSGALLDLDLACLCETRAFVVRGNALVIDVLDGPALSGVATVSNEPGTGAAADVAPRQPAQQVDQPPLPAPPVSATALDPAAVPVPDATAAGWPRGAPGRPVLPGGDPGPPVPNDAAAARAPASDPNIAGLLAREIGRAATFGIVTPDLANRLPGDADTDLADLPPGAVSGNLRIRTPGLGPSPSADADAMAGQLAPGCPRQDDFALADWVPADGDIAGALARSRALLFNERDIVDPAAAIALARLYIGAGFGAEAGHVLDMSGRDGPEVDLLRDLADLVDGGATEMRVIASLTDCPGRAELWTTLAAADGRPRVDDPDAVLVALGELPLPLRRHIAPRVAERLLAVGHSDAAEGARRLVARAPGPHGAPFDLVSARLDSRVGGGESALAGLALGSSTVSGEALAEFLELMNARGLPVDGRFVDLADVQAYEFRSVPLGARLETALIRAHLSRNDFPTAFARIERADREGFIAPATIAMLSRQFVTDLSERASDADFVLFGLAYLDAALPMGLGAETMTMAARRFLDLRLPDNALPYLDHAGSGAAARLARALHAMQKDDPGGAVDLIAGLDGDAADILRAAALSRLGRHADAARLLAERGEVPRATDEFWKAGAWADVAERTDDARAEAARLLTGADPNSDAETPVTQRERIEDVLARSSDVRATLDTLLAEVARP